MTITKQARPGSISGCVIDCGKPDAGKSDTNKPSKGKSKPSFENAQPISDADVALFCVDPSTAGATPEQTVCSNEDGCFEFKGLAPRTYWVRCCAFAWEQILPVDVTAGCDSHICFEVPLAFNSQMLVSMEDCTAPIPCDHVTAGRPVLLRAGCVSDLIRDSVAYTWSAPGGSFLKASADNEQFFMTDGTSGAVPLTVKMRYLGNNSATATSTQDLSVTPAWHSAARQAAGDAWAGGGAGNGSTGGNGGGFRGGAGGFSGPAGKMPNVGVMLQRASVPPTPRLGFWARIRNHAKAVSFGGIGPKGPNGERLSRGYQGFIDRVLCEGLDPKARIDLESKLVDGCPAPDIASLKGSANLPLHGMAAYELLMTATEIFLLWNCGVAIRPSDATGSNILSDEEEFSRAGLNGADMVTYLGKYLPQGRLPYIQRVVDTAFPGYVRGNSVFCTGVLSGRVDCVCLIELIWSYWLEEGMLAQTLNAISRRFQNIRGPGDRDPLAHLEIDPLRPLNNLMWGYLQNEQNQLTVKRRAYEYDHHYGLTLYGKAVPTLRSADSRSKFIEGFHNLLHRTSQFYKEDNDTTVIADGFPLINALKEVHLLLAQGAHNQFGDLPWTARAEMMVQQWLLARPEMRDFLQSRAMVPYTEGWMPQVDTMKTMQGWSDVTITHFRDLAVYGEQILLSIRYDDWIELNDENEAKNWARYWRPEIQSYIHAYRTVTGVDLTNPDTVDYTIPAVHLRKRLALQQAR